MVSDEVLGIFVPIIIYWLYSGLYVVFGTSEKHRLFTEEEDGKNRVTRGEVVKGVLRLQLSQILLLSLVYKCIGGKAAEGGQYALSTTVTIAKQLTIAVLVFDAWQYWFHRISHTNFLYKRIHAQHHRLIVPYPYGAQYGHFMDGFIGDVVGGSVAAVVSGMSPRLSIFFFSFTTAKAVDDHCGMWFPNHPFHRWFSNNSATHATHHQLYGFKYNFSAPFLTVWDKLMGTYLPYTVVKREDGPGWKIIPELPTSKQD